MTVICKTCGGKGRIIDPTIANGTVMSYYNPNTGDSVPHVMCRTCSGSGWTTDSK